MKALLACAAAMLVVGCEKDAPTKPENLYDVACKGGNAWHGVGVWVNTAGVVRMYDPLDASKMVALAQPFMDCVVNAVPK